MLNKFTRHVFGTWIIWSIVSLFNIKVREREGANNSRWKPKVDILTKTLEVEIVAAICGELFKIYVSFSQHSKWEQNSSKFTWKNRILRNQMLHCLASCFDWRKMDEMPQIIWTNIPWYQMQYKHRGTLSSILAKVSDKNNNE